MVICDILSWILNTLSHIHAKTTYTDIHTPWYKLQWCIYIHTDTHTHEISLFMSPRGVWLWQDVIKPLMATTHVSAQFSCDKMWTCAHKHTHRNTQSLTTWIINFEKQPKKKPTTKKQKKKKERDDRRSVKIVLVKQLFCPLWQFSFWTMVLKCLHAECVKRVWLVYNFRAFTSWEKSYISTNIFILYICISVECSTD